VSVEIPQGWRRISGDFDLLIVDEAHDIGYGIKRNNVYFENEYKISASHMQKPAYEAIANKKFEDVAYFEPFYLKDFLVTKPVKNILGQ
jgi:hypothetical protein